MARAKQIRFTQSELIRAAYMAGAGYSAGEIAEAIGRGATAQSIYSLLNRHAIRLTPKTWAQIAFPVVVNRALFEKIEEAAVRRDSCPKALAGKILEQVASDSTLLSGMATAATGGEASTLEGATHIIETKR
jgi:hypothetical protein